MSPLLLRSSFGYLWRHPWQFGLSLLGIALGVAVVVSIDLSSASARRAFELSQASVLGRTTHRVVGGPSGLDELIYARIRRHPRGFEATPIIEGHVVLAEQPGRAFTLLGVDPLAEAPFRPYLSAGGAQDLDIQSLLTEPSTALVAEELASELGIEVGGRFAIRAAGRRLELRLVGLIAPSEGIEAQALGDLVIVDISTAQETLGYWGRLSRVDLILDDRAGGAAIMAELQAALPDGVRIEPAEAGSATAREMTRAFEVNLAMLSLLALVVGMFLIYNAMTFSVIQRRQLIGNLRALGVTRAEVFALVILEAAFLGLCGVCLGLGLGVALAIHLVELFTQTINDLYYVLNVRDLTVSSGVLAKGSVLGLGAAISAACVPALEATQVPPRVALIRSLTESRLRELAPRLAVAGAIFIGLGVVVAVGPAAGVEAGFVALFALVVGASLLTPWSTLLVVRAVAPLAARFGGSLGRLAVGGVSSSLSRTAIAIAALMVALSATVGVQTMVDSFRRSVAQWLDTILQADVYISLPDPGQGGIDPDVIQRIAALEGIAELSKGRSVTAESGAGEIEVVALEMASRSYAGFELIAGDPEVAWPAFDEGEGVLVTEPYAYRRGLEVGDGIEVATDRGPSRFTLVGVVRDYSSERGAIYMSRGLFERKWEDRAYSTLGVYLRDPGQSSRIIEALRVAIGDAQELRIRANRSIRSASLAVFDRTFRITSVLQVLATTIACVGVLSALMALQLERARDVAILRSLGLTQGQVLKLVTTQTTLMGLISGLMSVPLGLAMSLMLILVINRRSFGWSIDVHMDPLIIAQSVGLAVAAAFLAGLYPSYRIARTSPALALRDA